MIVLFSLLLLAGVVVAQTSDADKCGKLCAFGVGEDTSKCWVLGAVPSNLGSDLIFWTPASQTVRRRSLPIDPIN